MSKVIKLPPPNEPREWKMIEVIEASALAILDENTLFIEKRFYEALRLRFQGAVANTQYFIDTLKKAEVEIKILQNELRRKTSRSS